MKTYDGLQCGNRIVLGCFLAWSASEFLLSTAGDAPRVLVPDPIVLMGGRFLASMMLVVSVWLAFGVRTRVMACLALGLFAGMALLMPGLERLSIQSLSSVGLFTVLALPLIFGGGGRYSLLRGGWRVPL